MQPSTQPIGYIIGGSLKENFNARLTISPQDIQEGTFVVIESGNWLYYGLVTDIRLGATDPRFADEQETRLMPELARLLHGKTLFTNLEILPALMLEQGPTLESDEYASWRLAHPEDPKASHVKTVPPHHAKVYLANEGHIAEIFGTEREKGFFVVGHTREQGHPICLNLDKFIQRSAGVFGATGTGKSFLTRLLLAGLIRHDHASLLVFDMHNEYGFDDIAADTGQRVTGLRRPFASKVRVVGLGKGATIRDQVPDFNLEIAMKDIQPEDIILLTRELNLKETTPTTLAALVQEFNQEWFAEFRRLRTSAYDVTEDGKRVPAEDSVIAWANQAGVHPAAAEGLHSKLGRVFNKSYIVKEPASDAVGEIIKTLEAGQHVVLSFGKHEGDLDYLLVSNLLTRKIRERWESKTNNFRSSGKEEPRPLVIVLEEAHKLLNREMASQTTFSTIARELRKYYVTLLIVDQRPSQIYDEVMSQLGTRVSGWLGDDDDIRAVLSGLAGRDALRGMLARLQPTEEVLLLGWGVPMPLPVRSRRYNEQFWNELLGKSTPKRPEAILKELGFD